MFLLLAAFSVSLIYMKILVRIDGNMRFFIWGLFAPLSSVALLIWPIPILYMKLILGPMLEELAKGIIIKNGHQGVATGAGFSATENMAYIAVYPEEYTLHILRMLFTAPMHMLVTRQTGLGIEEGKPVSGYLFAVALHSGWNLMSILIFM